jgi:hypothetical protein
VRINPRHIAAFPSCSEFYNFKINYFSIASCQVIEKPYVSIYTPTGALLGYLLALSSLINAYIFCQH